MNSLIVFPDEQRDDSLIVIEGKRAGELCARYQALRGQEIRIAILGGMKGTAKVTEVTSNRIRCEIIALRESTPLKPIDLIVGLSRPQTMKKVVQAAVMIGARSIHCVRTQRGERSYGTATLFEPQQLQEEIIKALEQVGEGLAPQVTVHRTFSFFIRNHLDRIANVEAVKLIAHPEGNRLTPEFSVGEARSVVVAVGPEAGWAEEELAVFERAGFQRVGLGSRVLRVEIALVFLLGQICLLRADSEKSQSER